MVTDTDSGRIATYYGTGGIWWIDCLIIQAKKAIIQIHYASIAPSYTGKIP